LIALFRTLLDRFLAFGFSLAGALVRGIFGALLGRSMPRVRRATAAEVLPLRAKILRPNQPIDAARWDCDPLPDTRHWLISEGDRVLGVATVLKSPFPAGDGPSWQLRGMAVDDGERGRGTGRRLLEAVVAEVGAPLWCNARTSAVPFYEKAGWRVVSDPFDIAGVGEHKRMMSS
jgi:GNAT superfamily N-acetyltransferase